LRQTVGVSNASSAPLTISPDGQRVAFAATGPDGKNLLWIRSLDALDAQSLPGTDDAASPFWSPDSRFLGFFAGGKLKKIDIAGGPPVILCDAPTGQGAAWSRDGVIVFEQYTGGDAVLKKVPAAGGTPTPAVVFEKGEIRSQRPFFLPDGRHFLFETEKEAGTGQPIYAGSLDSTERKFLLNSDASNVAYSQGHLFFLREATLMAQPFDAQRLELTGEAFPVAEQIRTGGVGELWAHFSVSENGVLVFQTGEGAGGFQLTWFDRAGKQLGVLGDRGRYGDVWLSPDEKRVTVRIPTSNGTGDIWVYDVARGIKTRFTFDAADERAPIWSPDGRSVVVNSNRKGNYNLYLKPASGAGAEEPLLEDNTDKYPTSWSADGRFLLYRSGPAPYDLFVLPLSGDRKPMPFTQTPFSEQQGQFSFDGRWVAYHSNESGRNEIYVVPFPKPSGKWQISTGGGQYPKWSHDGKEIFYMTLDNNRLMAATVNASGENFEVVGVKELFEPRALSGSGPPYNPTADGRRFLINTVPAETSNAPITVVVNWLAGVKK
jgi:Tol biopolymer transport system component